MRTPRMSDVLRHAGAIVALAAGFASLSACSSDDKRPLLLVNVDVATYLSQGAEAVAIAVTLGGVQLAQMSASVPAHPEGRFGVYLPDGTSGKVTVDVAVVGSGGCVLARGSQADVAVKPGEKTAPVVVSLAPSGDPCVGDASVPDTALPAEEVGPPLDVSGGDVDTAKGEVTTPVEGGRDAGADTRAPDAVTLEVGQPDGGPDRPVGIDGGDDAPADLSIGSEAGTDVAVLPDVQPDSAEAGSTPMNLLTTCTRYTHSELDSQDAAMNWGVVQVLFTPDGQYLVSAGEDARIKVWSVTATGIAPHATNLVFPGGRQNPTVALSPDGKYLAIGHGFDVGIAIYDFPASVADGVAAVKWTIPRSLAPAGAYSIARMQFTTDGGHLVAFYRGDTGKPHELVVWELATTATIMKQVTYPSEEYVEAVVPDSYPGPVIVASVAVAYGDGGYQSTLTVTDVIAIPGSKAQATLPGTIDEVAFAPDGSVLVGMEDSGEVIRWTVSGANLIRQTPAAILEGAAGGVNHSDFAFTRDGKYLAAAMDDADSAYVTLVALEANLPSRTKKVDYTPWSVAFAPGERALAIGEAFLGVILYCTP